MKKLNKQVVSNNEYVRRLQAEQRKYMGQAPVLRAGDKRVNAAMTNDGERAKEFARRILAGWDKVSYPRR